MTRLPRLPRLLLAASACAAAFAAQARDYADDAREARAAGRHAVSVFVDVDFGGREDRAAKALNQAHAAFGQQGYELVDVTAYTENGDLQGFFVSYRRTPPR
jgi:hypothetical protein